MKKFLFSKYVSLDCVENEQVPNSSINSVNIRQISRLQSLYVRNQKQKKVKNLRCFPCCSRFGHTDITYCGQPYEIEITGPRHLQEAFHSYYAVGQFTTILESKLNSIGMKTSLPNLYDRIRQGEVFVGAAEKCKVDDNQFSTKLVFGKGSNGWNYPYRSNRFDDTNHVFKVFILKEIQPTCHDPSKRLEIIAEHCSSAFRIVSTRRKTSPKAQHSHDTIFESIQCENCNVANFKLDTYESTLKRKFSEMI